MKLSEAKARGVIKRKIDISEHFGVDKGQAWIEFREPSKDEAIKLQDYKGKEGWEGAFLEEIKNYIVDHSFVKDSEGKEVKATNEEVSSMILESFTLTEKVVKGWMETLPLRKGSDSNYDSSGGSALPAENSSPTS